MNENPFYSKSLLDPDSKKKRLFKTFFIYYLPALKNCHKFCCLDLNRDPFIINN